MMDFTKVTLSELRQMWTRIWGHEPHARIGRTMLEKSLEYRLYESEHGTLSFEDQARLEQLIKQYKRNRGCFDRRNSALKPGTQLVRIHAGKKHIVHVITNGFEYQGQIYSSLSVIANAITGKHWNGWVFFGLKKARVQ